MNTLPATRFEKAIVLAALLGLAYLILIAVTGLAPSEEPVDTGRQICIEDEAPSYPDPHPPEFYSIIYPVDGPDVLRDKNGEIITMDPLLASATRDPAATPDGHTDHPVMPWIEQSMAGQSPPVLYWPAPAYKQTIRKPAKPCADRYKPVTEPGILALIGAALLAAGVVK